MATLTMTDVQKCRAGLVINDVDGQPIVGIPAGWTVSFAVVDAQVCDFVVDADGLNGTVTSGKVGATSINANVTKADASVVSANLPVVILNSDPSDVLDFVAGTPEAE